MTAAFPTSYLLWAAVGAAFVFPVSPTILRRCGANLRSALVIPRKSRYNKLFEFIKARCGNEAGRQRASVFAPKEKQTPRAPPRFRAARCAAVF